MTVFYSCWISEDRNWAIATHGYAIEVFTDAGQSYIMDQVKPYLSDGDYNEAFHKFATECDDFITQANEAEPSMWKTFRMSLAVGINLLIALAVGLVAGLLVTGNMRRKLKTVRKTGSGGFLCAAGQYECDQK